MRLPSIPIAACCCALALACGDTTGPDALEGTWYLQVYNDSIMPGRAVAQVAGDSNVIEVDSVRLVLGTESGCGWVVALTADPVNTATSCTWEQNVGPDDLVVIVNGTFILRGDVLPARLHLRDPNANRLEFGRDRPTIGPVQPEPVLTGDR